jgi:long-chain-fatty-acid--[acyl-carrier-protein] ligase
MGNSMFLTLLRIFARFLVSLRYRLVVKGLEDLTPKCFERPGGILFLPNHPAEIDPVLLELVLWKRFEPRPLVVEHFYELKGFKFFMDQVKAMPLPTMDAAATSRKAKKVEKQFNNIAEALRSKENFLIYPSGRLKITGTEVVGGASFVHKLVQTVPEANVVLVRTTGLWGSQFSKALTGISPNFGKVLWECSKLLLKNGIFFAPRREVLIELQKAPADFPYTADRLGFNKYLENWYNRYPDPGPEPIKLVSFAFWKEKMPSVFIPTEKKQGEKTPVSKKVEQEVFAFLGSLSGKSGDQIQPEMQLSVHLGLDSLDVVQVYVFLSEHYGVDHLQPGDLMSVEDVLQYASGYKAPSETGGPKTGVTRANFPEEQRFTPMILPAATLQEAFLLSAERGGKLTAAVDGLSGALSYSRLKLASLLLSKQFQKLPGDRIGILLPASSGAYLMILGVLLAGKVPVMLNWTVGMKALDHAVDLTGITTVITSEKFLDRVEDADLGKIEGMFHFVEEIRKKITLKDKLTAFLLSLKKAKTLLKQKHLAVIKPADPAVILFTSGTESVPKGVPLSHENLLSNQRLAMQAVALLSDDIFYGVLPPFHSFGFSVTGLLPLLAGIRVCYSPDPTDSRGVVRDIGEWKATIFCCAPSFIKAAFRVAYPAQLQSLRLVVSGAEKTPQELFDYVQRNIPHAHLLEGYGITECSPIVTIDRLEEPHAGVGKPIPGVDLLIWDSNLSKPVAQGQEGEICIAGSNVFGGYLGSPRNPFISALGRQWYLSGDRGLIDEKGHLILSGRLKRFVKIGGEMVSLGGLEEEILRLAKEKRWLKGQGEGPALAIIAQEKEADKPVIILYSTFPITLEEVNSSLKESGHGRIAKIGQVTVLDQIPLTGTGKTDYRSLEEMGSRQ